MGTGVHQPGIKTFGQPEVSFVPGISEERAVCPCEGHCCTLWGPGASLGLRKDRAGPRAWIPAPALTKPTSQAAGPHCNVGMRASAHAELLGTCFQGLCGGQSWTWAAAGSPSWLFAVPVVPSRAVRTAGSATPAAGTREVPVCVTGLFLAFTFKRHKRTGEIILTYFT